MEAPIAPEIAKYLSDLNEGRKLVSAMRESTLTNADVDVKMDDGVVLTFLIDGGILLKKPEAAKFEAGTFKKAVVAG